MASQGTVEVGLATVELPGPVALSHGRLKAGRYARLTVRDAGQGMDEATLGRIFEPFFTTKATGTGLGLASVHGIVAEHGGALDVRSRPGEGSSFAAYLACPKDFAAVAAASGEPAPLARGHGETVLLVDDEQPLVLLGEEMLAALGYEPVGYDSSPDEALAAFRAAPGRFDALLADEVMPALTGTELAAAVHRIRPELPVILMTGHGGEAGRQRHLQAAGVKEVLRKPLLARDIAQSLARHLHPGG
jgi:CheY-like chemotaxis protein